MSFCLPTSRPGDLDEVLRLAEIADAAPLWDTVWVADSLLALPVAESMMLLAACAARTRRVRLGVSCQASLGLREPILLAAQWATADVVSRGRVTLVACPGWGSGEAVRRELRAFGVDYREKTRRMEVNVAALREASRTGRVVGADGSEAALPGPFVQRPLPILFAANPAEDAPSETVERLLARVARLGDGWMTYAARPETLAGRVARVRELRGDDAYPVWVGVNTSVAADERRARRAARDAWARQGTRGLGADDLGGIAAIGRPEACAEFYARLADAGATGIAVYPLGDAPRAQLELLSDHLPALIEVTA